MRSGNGCLPTIFGIVSNGKVWEFAQLSDRLFTKNIKPYRIYDLEELFAAVNYVFDRCKVQILDSET